MLFVVEKGIHTMDLVVCVCMLRGTGVVRNEWRSFYQS